MHSCEDILMLLDACDPRHVAHLKSKKWDGSTVQQAFKLVCVHSNDHLLFLLSKSLYASLNYQLHKVCIRATIMQILYQPNVLGTLCNQELVNNIP